MEHRLVTGGNEFLPLARSCVAKLKKLGLCYADQSFEVGGVSIKVRIEPGHEYIRIDGGVTILSGVVREGEVIHIPPSGSTPTKYTLRSYKPTQNSWDYPLGKSPAKSPATFSDEKFLVRSTHDTTQYSDLCPSMYSGLMAQAVSIIMGRGVEVKYGYKWAKCHGITLDDDEKPWLVEISQENGVIAMRLPMDKGNATSKVDAELEIVKLLGGVPSGRTFPKDIVAAEEDGRVIRLASVQDMEDYFSKDPYSSIMGWSFNPTGSEGHNTCFTVVDGVARGFHYKLAIEITSGESESSRNATLSLVGDGLFSYRSPSSSRFMFYEEQDGVAYMSPPPNTAEGLDSPSSSSAPILACHINGVLDVVTYNSLDTAGDYHFSSGAPPFTIITNTYSSDPEGGRVHCIKSTSNPDAGGYFSLYSLVDFADGSELTWLVYPFLADSIYLRTTTFYTSRIVTHVCTGGIQSGVWPEGTRDAYVVYKSGGVEYQLEEYRAGDSVTTFGYITTFEPGGYVMPPGKYTPRATELKSTFTVIHGTDVTNGGLLYRAESAPAKAAALTPTVQITLSLTDLGPYTGWINVYYVCRYEVFTLRCSAFGRPHYTVSRMESLSSHDLSGPMLATEDTPTDTNYTFIGYT